MTFAVSLYENLYRPQTCSQDFTGEELVELLTAPVEAENVYNKGLLPMWSPVLLSPGYRKKVNVVRASCLVLDYDDGTTIEAALETWGDWYRVLHTSWSHHENHHRFRLVLPLRRDVTPDEYPALWRWAEMHSERQVDKACKDISRAWALPAVDVHDPEHRDRYDWRVEAGALLDPDEVIPSAPPLPKKVNYKRVNLRDLPDASHLKAVHLDPESRAELGHALGGVVLDNVVKYVECPRCRRESVWWWIDPNRLISAYCNHQQSCGWKGPVVALVEYQRADEEDINEALLG